MRMFDRERVYSQGLSLLELAVIGLGAGVISLASGIISASAGSSLGWSAAFHWPALRDPFGIAVGVPLFGLAARRLHLGLAGQFFAIPFAVAGGGPSIILLAESLARLF